jgi:IS4 transposase
LKNGRHKINCIILRQICNFIPPHFVPKLARDTGVAKQWRDFSPWSHVVSLLYAQLTHSLGLNQLCEMVFLTNNLEWSAQTIADLYRCRWRIETFFKELKQTIQLADFLGHSQRAVKWQVWTALLAYVLLRFCAQERNDYDG